MLPTIVGRSAEGSGMLPTIVGRSAGGLGMLPTIVGKSAEGSGVFPTIVGCLLPRKVSIIGGFANGLAGKIWEADFFVLRLDFRAKPNPQELEKSSCGFIKRNVVYCHCSKTTFQCPSHDTMVRSPARICMPTFSSVSEGAERV